MTTITDNQKSKLFEETLFWEELTEETTNAEVKVHYGEFSCGMKRSLKLIGLLEEYENWKKEQK